MDIYRAQFRGRKKNAEGIFYPIDTYCYGIDRNDAELSLYDQYDHISGLKMTLAPVVAANDVPVGSCCFRIMRIAGFARLRGQEDPHNSMYRRTNEKQFVDIVGEPCFINSGSGIASKMEADEFVVHN